MVDQQSAPSESRRRSRPLRPETLAPAHETRAAPPTLVLIPPATSAAGGAVIGGPTLGLPGEWCERGVPAVPSVATELITSSVATLGTATVGLRMPVVGGPGRDQAPVGKGATGSAPVTEHRTGHQLGRTGERVTVTVPAPEGRRDQVPLLDPDRGVMVCSRATSWV